MNFSFYLKLFLLTIPVFFLIDMIWLGTMIPTFYRKRLGHLMSPKPNWIAAFIFYFIFIIGILFFAVVPNLGEGSWQHALFLGAMYGLFTYATYNLTNLATLNNWSPTVVVVDIIWGMFLCGSVASLSYLIGEWLI